MPEAMAQSIESIWIVALVAAIAIVAFWRMMIKCVIIFAAMTIIATLAFSAITLWQALRYLFG
jgi:hypothetical protein